MLGLIPDDHKVDLPINNCLLLQAIPLINLSCHLEEVETSGEDKNSDLKLKALRSDSMNMFW
jgi:hypothetical protein